jgi:hypothetical protein
MNRHKTADDIERKKDSMMANLATPKNMELTDRQNSRTHIFNTNPNIKEEDAPSNYEQENDESFVPSIELPD